MKTQQILERIRRELYRVENVGCLTNENALRVNAIDNAFERIAYALETYQYETNDRRDTIVNELASIGALYLLSRDDERVIEIETNQTENEQ